MADGEGSSPEATAVGASSSAADATTSGGDGCIKEQDRLLPIANVGRIMKQILPPNAKISKEAKETMQECASEFISFVTGEASDKCHKEKRKTVNGDDICWALGTLGFDDYAEPMKRYLHKYRDYEGERAAASGAAGHNKPGGGGGTDHLGNESPDFRGDHQLMRNQQQQRQRQRQQLPPASSPTLRFNVMERHNASTSKHH